MSHSRFGTAFLAIAAASLAVVASAGAASAATGSTTTAVAPASAMSYCGTDDVGIYFKGGSVYCDPSHSNHRITVNRCDVTEVISGANWVATWYGPDMQHLQYVALKPHYFLSGSGTFCVGDVAVNP